MKSLMIINDCLEPAYNLAAEEYICANFTAIAGGAGRVVTFWRNSRSVIIGKNQNAYTETDPAYAGAHGIGIFRRRTGGGAVFHDPGNVNYTVIEPDSEELRLNYSHFSQDVRTALSKLGLDVSLSGRNDLVCGDRKISGSAQCVDGGVIMHHGTLLFSAELGDMAAVLRPDPEKLSKRGIASVSSRVANIRDLLPQGSRVKTVEDFLAFMRNSCEGERREFTDAEKSAISELAARKYATWEWNMGRSPAFSVERSRRFGFGRITAGFDAEGGVITRISFTGDFIGERPVSELEERLAGLRLTQEDIAPALRGAGAYFSCTDDEAKEALRELIR